MRRSLGTVLSVMLLGGLVWGAATIPLPSSPTGNQRRDGLTSAQVIEMRKDAASDGRSRQEWLRRIEEDHTSFAEAACVYERHGWWDQATSKCDLAFDSRLKQGK